MLYGWVFGGPLLIAIITAPLRTLGWEEASELIVPALIIAWFIGFITLSIRAGGFRCPRCGETFFSGSWYYNGFARWCVHCGLPKWQDG
jgi:hypothetical protein